MTPDRWIGSRDRSWGIRPVGEAEPPGAPADPPFEGMWWLYVPMRFDDFAIVLIIQEEPGRLPDPQRLHPDLEGRPGRAARLAAGARSTTPPAPGSRPARRSRAPRPDGKPVQLEVESLLPVPIHVGGGYGGDPDWTHGMWKGAGFTERVTYDLNDPDVAGRVMFGVIDHVGRAVCARGGAARAGGSSSTAPSAGTTPAASPTGSRSPR